MKRQYTSEDIAHRAAKQDWLKRFLKFAVPSIVALAIVLVIFFDPRALALSFVFVMGSVLFVVFTVGAPNKKQQRSKNRSHYRGRFGGVGGVGGRMPAGGVGRHSSGSGAGASGGNKQSSGSHQSPYTTPEGYEALLRAHQDAKQSQKLNPNQPKQSQLGAQISNTTLIILLFLAVIVIWIFG